MGALFNGTEADFSFKSSLRAHCMSKVFISYRRDDGKYPARSIFRAFAEMLPPNSVFMDVDSIPLGADFVESLERSVSQCEILLALIGPGWINATDPATKKPRLHDENDFVRVEIRGALTRGVRVVPVLLDGAPMPDAGVLPDDLKKLARRQAEYVDFRTFEHDVQRLIKKLGLESVQPVARDDEPTAEKAEGRDWRHALAPAEKGIPPERAEKSAHVPAGIRKIGVDDERKRLDWRDRDQLELYVIACLSVGMKPALPIEHEPQLSRLRFLEEAITSGELEATLSHGSPEIPDVGATVSMSDLEYFANIQKHEDLLRLVRRWKRIEKDDSEDSRDEVSKPPLLRLAELRREGSRLRNAATGLQSIEAVASWIANLERWRSEVTGEIERISPMDSRTWQTIDELPRPRYELPSYVSFGHFNAYREQDFLLDRLKDLINRYHTMNS